MEEGARGSSMCTKRRLAVIVTVVTLVAVSLVAVSVGVYWERQGPLPLLTRILMDIFNARGLLSNFHDDLP